MATTTGNAFLLIKNIESSCTTNSQKPGVKGSSVASYIAYFRCAENKNFLVQGPLSKTHFSMQCKASSYCYTYLCFQDEWYPFRSDRKSLAIVATLGIEVLYWAHCFIWPASFTNFRRLSIVLKVSCLPYRPHLQRGSLFSGKINTLY